MKKIFTLLFLSINSLNLCAQWSNTTNQFYDSLQMPVCTSVGDQMHPMSLISYPDLGTIVFWEDKRAGYYSNTQLFAQKFDKDGNRLWVVNGISISSSANNQHFTWSSNEDYRNRTVAATDSAGGFYLTYTDDSIATYAWYRMCVQHIKNDGSVVFPGPGFIVAQPTVAAGDNYTSPQLIADDNRGFYISYIQNRNNDNIYVYCYKDEGGTMKAFGGGIVNYNGIQDQNGPICPSADVRRFITYPGTTVIDYNIWPDLQGGCSVIMSLNGNIGSQYKMLAYNRAFKVKKSSTVSVATYFPSGNPDNLTINYAKGDVDILYQLKHVLLDENCTDPNTGYHVWVDDILLSNGYLLLDQGGYDYNFPKGVAVSTNGNINVELMASTTRTLTGNSVSNFIVYGIGRSVEIYDSVPYQRASNSNPLLGFNPIQPAQVNKLNNFRDTLIGEGKYYYDFSLAGDGLQFYAAALTWEPDGSSFNERKVRLQHLALERKTSDSFAIAFKTNSNKGDMIGREVSTGFSGSNISYDFPLVSVSKNGNAFFYIREYYRSARVSPIFNGSELAWGAMGKPISTGVFNGGYYNLEQPFTTVDPINGTGVISWMDNKNIPGATGQNIFFRHLDNLNVENYFPPNHLVKQLINPYGSITANPAVLLGTSKTYTSLEAYSGYSGHDVTTPVVEILDNYNLGNVAVSVYENTGAVRTFNGQPYLDRNYTITPENNPAGSAKINVRLYFTQAEFDALKAADPKITSPADLAVIKQPATGTAPASFIFVAGAETIFPQSWSAVPGGYYIEIAVSSFSNFFIQKANSTLPLQWLNVSAQWMNNTNSKVSWQVAQEVNVKNYTVQQSLDGINFKNAYQVAANNSTVYSCTLGAEANTVHYYRVLQTDIDGKSSMSKIVTLQSVANVGQSVYPNPVKNILSIKGLNAASPVNVIVTNAAGNIVGKLVATPNNYSMDVSNLPAGQYYINIDINNRITNLKFIKE